MTAIPKEVQEYIDLVRGGEFPSCKEQHQLIAHVEKCFSTEKLRVDYWRIEKYLSYQQYFPFELFPWEKFCFVLHNCIFDAMGLPRWADLLLLVGRGAGKNGYLAYEDFCLITETNGIPQYNIDICATSEDQARTSFDDIYNVLENPKFAKRFMKNFYWTKTLIENKKTKSQIRYRTNNPKGKDGLRSGKVDFDEPHAYENWENINVFTTGLGKKPHPRRTYTSTDGDVRDGPLDQLKEKSRAILDGEIPDSGFLPFICKLDEKAEVHNKNNWHKANPSLRYLPSLMAQIEREYADYLIDPVINDAFMTKRMNLPQGRSDIEVTAWENILKTNRPLPDLTGRSCVCGIDYTKTTDFMSAFLLFKDGDEYYGIHHSWFCNRSGDAGRIKIPLSQMVERGLLTIVDDVEINPRIISEWIYEQNKKYSIEKIAVDSYRYTLLSRELSRIGFEAKDGKVKLIRPSDIMLVQPVINSVFARGAIAWGDDALMRWYTNNTKLEPTKNNNYTYGKIEPKSRKTDGFMAYVASMCIEGDIAERHEAAIMPTLIF